MLPWTLHKVTFVLVSISAICAVLETGFRIRRAVSCSGLGDLMNFPRNPNSRSIPVNVCFNFAFPTIFCI